MVNNLHKYMFFFVFLVKSQTVVLDYSVNLPIFKNFFAGVTVLLAFSVFMLAIAEKMPETSESIPLIGKFFELDICSFCPQNRSLSHGPLGIFRGQRLQNQSLSLVEILLLRS